MRLWIFLILVVSGMHNALAARPANEKDLRNDKALHFVLNVDSVTSEERKEAKADGDMQCHLLGHVQVVRNGGRKDDRIPFKYKEGDVMLIDMGCTSTPFFQAPGAVSGSEAQLHKAKTVEFWGTMALRNPDGSILLQGVASVMPEFEWKEHKNGIPFFMPYDFQVLEAQKDD